MYPTFQGQVKDGRLHVDELQSRGERMLAGKQVAVVVLEDEAAGNTGQVRTGRYDRGALSGGNGSSSLRELEGKQALVIVCDDLVGAGKVDAFDQKFQLGAKIGDLDT